MNEVNPPVQSLRSLILATVSALFLATVILITAVLPAEYGIDPTGLGKRLGLTQLSAQGEDIIDPMVSSCKDQLAQWTDSTTLVIPVHSGLEYKFYVLKGEKLDYSWSTDGAKVYFDLHGEPKGDKTGFFKSFKVGSESRHSAPSEQKNYLNCNATYLHMAYREYRRNIQKLQPGSFGPHSRHG
ncbi:conserved hypothetical protein [Crenothrix polyspora]|uniref:Uncharacterized protein n=1 Tax=Crenothrix polyspora TaxID=360316 RepID=A0A1R4HIC8_9GAMM|nr:hypothetical protein [Crenothrix polyspora]SJM95994.1 conserved hypothetical protein [Crenothrix polyspora]